ncbi:glycosyltransferase involved in cell wall biosynthesis [Runella defluvii]|uniref:Glycosyltransferase involved in cell wall biosynthesis n=1 Tax=Runella defluvii TaxID=370973 RepID=A0A7W6ENH5_9BACT|nr:glycosyltransferase [Runella defluvii]MBB3836413.1 glycosyltransferase involved in cell wall biosynthesis [Runella defluvii]
MKLVFLAHPKFINLPSMERFRNLLVNGMQQRGHMVSVWEPKAIFFLLPFSGNIRKWLGYIDQFILFPFIIYIKTKFTTKKTLFVFLDHALGPWVPLLAHRPHVIHCHDFLAQLSALEQLPEHTTSTTGKLYQRYIRWGYSKGKNFICVSKQTQRDLNGLLPSPSKNALVVYNPLNPLFEFLTQENGRQFFESVTSLELSGGYLLHVGGNTWYKNRIGVLHLYIKWRSLSNKNLPLLLVGPPPTADMLALIANNKYQNDIHFLTQIDDISLRYAYAGATLFLFPSLAEGFGWPIIEAMSSGSIVMTTDVSPMNEIGGNAAVFISRYNKQVEDYEQWALKIAPLIESVCNWNPDKREQQVQLSLKNAKQFNVIEVLNKIENEYKKINNTFFQE